MKPLNVLVVDDDQSECELLRRTLHSADIQALTLTDSRQAVELLRNQAFDAIFVDVNMPPPDGMAVTKEIRNSTTNQRTPVIMMTGSDDPSLVARGFQSGISFFLYKPITKDRVLKLVRVTQSVNKVEKRRFHRVAVRQKVEVRLNDDILEGHTIDLSLNGLLVRASRTFPPGSRVRIRLGLSPGKASLDVGGTVTRVISLDSMGIHLDTIDINESRQLQDFLLPLIIASDSPTG
jgi:DNA-binding response OmpR family regulator